MLRLLEMPAIGKLYYHLSTVLTSTKVVLLTVGYLIHNLAERDKKDTWEDKYQVTNNNRELSCNYISYHIAELVRAEKGHSDWLPERPNFPIRTTKMGRLR